MGVSREVRRLGAGLVLLTGLTGAFVVAVPVRDASVPVSEEGCPAAPRVAKTVLAGQAGQSSTMGDTVGYCEVGRTADGYPVAVTFAPDATPEYVRRTMRAFARTTVGVDPGRLPQYNLPYNRWIDSAMGVVNPRGNAWLIFSRVPDGTPIPESGSFGSGSSSLFAVMNSKFPSGVDWTALLDRGFWPWSDQSGARFGNVGDDGRPMTLDYPGVVGVRGDIRIGAKPLDGPGGVLAYAYYPIYGEMVLDESENWANPTHDYRFLRNVVGHEVGHAIGLGHVSPCNGTKLMEPFIYTGYDSPQHDDLLGANHWYGDKAEGWDTNDVPQHAVGLGELSLGDVILGRDLSLHTAGDGDWFRFRAASDARLTIFVDPVGETYLVGNQNEPGCGAPTSQWNTLLAKDLQIWLYDATGSNVLKSAADEPRGASETLVFDVKGGKEYTFQIAGSADAEVQLYRASLHLQPPPFVSGSVELRDMAQDHYGLPLTFEIWDANGALVESHTLDVVASTFGSSDGQVLFEFESNLQGTYDLSCRGGTWLRKRLRNVVLPSRQHVLPLVNGDVNGDNTINIADFLLLRSHFGGNHEGADLNKDGTVSIADFLILRRGFGRSGD